MVVNEIIQSVANGLGLVGDGMTVNGTMASNLIHDLNSVIARLNLQSYILSSQKAVEVNAAGSIEFGTEELPMKPCLIKVVQRKVGKRYVNLVNARLSDVYNTTRTGLSALYTVDTSEGKLKITLDSLKPDTYNVIFLDSFPTFKLNDELPFTMEEVELLETGLAVEAIKRYKLFDYLTMYEKDFKEHKDLFKRKNIANRSLLVNNSIGSYMDSFYDGLNGRGW